MKIKNKKRPDEFKGKSIKELSAKHKDTLHRINKRKVSIHSAGDGSPDTTGETSGLFTPTADQLAVINQFTRKEVTADDIAAFSIDAMNDLLDRDDERFTTDTVDQFASLPQPYSFVGKSYMSDHEYKIANTRGRIFEVGTKSKQTELGRSKFLTASAYTPNTPQYADFLENLAFGLNWAVSVGVVVDKSECSICSAPVYTSRFSGWAWCDNGHEKGFYYVPGKEEEDGWGYYIPVDPGTKGAVKATVDLKDAIDGYEISQVFLGAQYMAQLEPKSAVAKMFKAAERSKLPILGLASDEAEEIKLLHEPDKVQEARNSYKVVVDNGVAKWTDDTGLVWAWDSNTDGEEILCLGKSTAPGPDDEAEHAKSVRAKIQKGRDLSARAKQETTDDEDDDPVELAESLDAVLDSADDAFDEGEIDQAEALVDAAETIVDQLLEALGGIDADEVDPENPVVSASVCSECGQVKNLKEVLDSLKGKEKPVGAKEVLAAAMKAKLPQTVLDKLVDAPGSGLEVVLTQCSKEINSGSEKMAELESKAAVGDLYIKDLESEVLHWFAVARRDPKNPGVNVSFAQKLIQRADGDIDLLKELIEDYKGEARAKFPQSTRRSVGVEDPNARNKEMPDLQFGPEDKDRRNEEIVSRLHRAGRE